MEPALTLANTPLDLQITICIFLHPSDILALRKTCKALELATRKRIVWVTVLHRVCFDNTLFLPSFPIPDMSVLELERAAMAPRRWIELCGAFQKQHNISVVPQPRTTRIIKDTANSLFIVPGGRYLVAAVASVGLGDDFNFIMVQATPDGKGLVILLYHSNITSLDHRSIFEIYPQSEIPLLTKIAHLDWLPSEEYPAHLLPDTLICRVFHEDRIVIRVVDYRTNYSTCFSADVDPEVSEAYLETFVTKTAIIVFCEKGIFIWAIPPLSPQPSDLRDLLLDDNPTHIPPLFKIPFPDGIARHYHEIRVWISPFSWYIGSSESVYFDILYSNLKLQRFKIIIKPDLSDASLHVMNMSEFISDDLMKCRVSNEYRICEDALVYFWNNLKTWGVYTGLTSAPFTNVVTRRNGHVRSLCPTSGRFVYCTVDGDGSNKRIVVVDLF